MKYLKTYENWTPSGSLAFDNASTDDLILAINNGDDKNLKTIIDEWNIDPNIDFIKITHYGDASNKELRNLEYLHNPNDPRIEEFNLDIDTFIPITYSTFKNNLKAYKILVKKYGADVNKRDLEGWNIFMLLTNQLTYNKSKMFICIDALKRGMKLIDSDWDRLRNNNTYIKYYLFQKALLSTHPQYIDKIIHVLDPRIKDDENFAHLIDSNELGLL